MEFEVSIERQQGTCTVIVSGEVDVYTSPQLKSALVEAADDGGCSVVVVDMDKVTFIDSSGLGVLVGALRRVREAGGDLRVVCGRENVVKIFRITGLDRVFAMFASVDEARGA
jgi:anti-sigma B factor antagonist